MNQGARCRSRERRSTVGKGLGLQLICVKTSELSQVLRGFQDPLAEPLRNVSSLNSETCPRGAQDVVDKTDSKLTVSGSGEKGNEKGSGPRRLERDGNEAPLKEKTQIRVC